MADSSEQGQASGATPDTPPPPPVPASDPSLFSSCDDPRDAPSPRLASMTDDIFDVSPLAALQLLGAGVEALVRITGDIPPTPPPPGAPVLTNMRGMQAEKEVIVRTLSQKSLAKMRAEAEREDAERYRKEQERRDAEPHTAATPGDRSTPPRDDEDDGRSSRPDAAQPPSTPRSRMPPTPPPARPIQVEIDGVHLRTDSPNRTPGSLPQSPPAAGSSAYAAAAAAVEPYIVIGANSQPLNVQHSAITRKFYSKKVPPISISEYLHRLHRFCPMSTGVYLATSLYIYRLAVAEKAIAVTRRNAHRLLLAGLRVAMKALEDLSYAHTKMARVGGVTEAELARLEINFCFLAGFELSVCAEDMRRHWTLMKSGRAVGSLDEDGTAAVIASMTTVNVPQRPKAPAANC